MSWKTAAFILIVAASVACAGCNSSNRGLHETMSSFHFTELTPPSAPWDPGSVVEIDRVTPDAPVLRSTPAMAGASIQVVSGPAPDVARNHNEKLDLNVGISLPQNIKGQVDTSLAHQYSVVATGNKIERVPLDPYAEVTFPTMRDRFGKNWTDAVNGQRLFYFYELWSATGLEYHFYDDKGAKVTAAIPLNGAANLDLGGGWTAKSDGSLTFSGGTIYLGYKARPVISVNGQVGPGGLATQPATQGTLTAARRRASNVPLDK